VFLILFFIALLLLLGLCAVVIRLAKPKDPGRVWLYLLGSLITVCTVDHIVGYLYAYAWVSLAKHGASVVHADAVAHQYSEEPQHSTWYDHLGGRNFDPWPPGTPREVYAGYLARKAAAGFAQVQGYPKSYKAPPEYGTPFEVRISTDPNDPECRWWDVGASVKEWNEDRIDKEQWLDQVRKNWKNGERAACPALHPISEVTAGYLVRTS